MAASLEIGIVMCKICKIQLLLFIDFMNQQCIVDIASLQVLSIENKSW